MIFSQAIAQDYPYRPVSPSSVDLQPGFWHQRLETNRRVTVTYCFDKCEETGRLDNFAVAGGLKEGESQGYWFNDSDVYKIIEGAAYCLKSVPDPDLDAYLDDLIATIAAAQEEDGYLYTARTIDPESPARWSELYRSHELYCAGHLYEAAVAHFRATGKRTLLDVAVKNADLLLQVFGPDGKRDVPGHQEIEIGLVKLGRATGKKEYIDLARFFLEERGRPNGRKLYGPGVQDHEPVADQTRAVGHAVRACYQYAGMADVGMALGVKEYIDAIDRIWEDVETSKLYITGGVGSSPAGEAFGDPYELPNESAYNETCAAIAHVLWNHRMYLIHGERKYMDVLERTLYNGALAGVSMDGKSFFYPNPLASRGKARSPWFACACCPSNVARFIPQIPGFMYAVKDDTIHVNLYAASTARIPLGERTVTITQETRYPWSGKVRLEIDPGEPSAFAIALRIPGWVQGRLGSLYAFAEDEPRPEVLEVKVNGETVDPTRPIRRAWSKGDAIEMEMAMPPLKVRTSSMVEANRGRIALQRGPLVYCFEAQDTGGKISDLFVTGKVVPEDGKGLLEGIKLLRVEARRVGRKEDDSVAITPAVIHAVPYYAWAHREIGEMSVWIPDSKEGVMLPKPPTIASTSKASASHVWHTDTILALNDQEDPETSDDHSIPRHTFWPRKGTTEWVQYDLPSPTEVSAAEVYWFDDTGIGSCRLPKAWRLLYPDGEEWKPVPNPSGFDVEKDRFCRVTFDPVTVTRLRIEVDLRDEFSGGILEWRVE
jgi:DUF1680 family protein